MRKVTITAQAERLAVEAAKNGNYEGFAKCVLAQKAQIVAQAFRLLNNKEAAEDLFGDVYVRAQTSISQFDPRLCKLKTWLFRITNNMAIDILRNKRISLQSQNKNNYSLSDENNRIDEKAWLPKTTIDDNFDAIQIVGEMVGNLPFEKRRLIEARYWQNATYSELMEEFKIPEGTLKGTLFRVRNELKKTLKHKGYTPESMV